MQSILEGCTPAENLAPEDVEDIARRKEEDTQRLSTYFQDRRRKNDKLVNPQYPNFAGHAVYGVYTNELFLACRAQGMNTVEDHLHASALVVSDITDIPEMLAWSAILGGKFICESKYVVTRGDKGLSIKYTAAASVRRKVHNTGELLRCNKEVSCAIMF